jgi:hypothetical protein
MTAVGVPVLRVVQRYIRCGVLTPTGYNSSTDGSAAADLIAPDDLTAFLVAVQGEPWFETWYAALPIAGEPEHLVGGALGDRMRGTAAAANLHSKTGSPTTSSALAGYVTTAVGERLVFSLVEDGFIGPAPKAVEDAFAVTLAEQADPVAYTRMSAAKGRGQMIAAETQIEAQGTTEAPAFPWKLWIYTNYDCNLRCSYCVAKSSPNALRRAIGLANVQRLIEESTLLGFVHAFFTGGEPFFAPRHLRHARLLVGANADYRADECHAAARVAPGEADRGCQRSPDRPGQPGRRVR